MTTYTNYAQFNTVAVAGRLCKSDVITKKDGTQFLSISLITTTMKDGPSVVFTANDSETLLRLAIEGKLPVGREVTLQGHIKDVTQVYTDTKTKEVKLLKTPQVSLLDASIPAGGLGRLPMDKSSVSKPAAGTVIKMTDAAPEVSAAPELTKEEAQAVAF